MEIPGPELEEGWRRWLVERNRRGLRAGSGMVLALYPAFGLLDLLSAPGHTLAWLWATRGAVVIATLALLRFTWMPAFDRWSTAATAGFAWLTAAGIAAMTAATGGMASPYYAGISLALTGAGLLFVWPVPIVIATHGATVATFVLANLARGAVGAPVTAASNLAFLAAMAVVAGVGQAFLFRTQLEQHAQRVRLEQATAGLARANAALQELDQFKTRFFANMTHELRTPLAMVLTPLELLLQGEMGPLTDAQRSSFQLMSRSALKLLRLIDDLLDLSRVEESHLRLRVAEHDLDLFLRALVDETGPLAERKGIRLEYRSRDVAGPVTVWCDLERLERVFLNLLSNAIKFTQPGGHVAVEVIDRPAEVEVRVVDDGPGFPPDQARRIFERFYQVDMAGTRRHGGAGIGLALAREMVLLHGGTIAAESDGASGAAFTVRLRKGRGHLRPDALATPPAGGVAPEHGADWAVRIAGRRDARLQEIEEAAERRVVERDQDEEARPHTAVVIEDSPAITRLVHLTLRREFKILAAADGAAGLEMVIRERPDLVVTDLMMPGLDGLELTRRLRADPRTHQIPIVMLTARGALDDRLQGLESGVDVFLAKPFAPRELLISARRLVRAGEESAELVLTQRMESLEVVAAGLAHEINNPLNYAKNALTGVDRDLRRLLALAGPAAAGEGEGAAAPGARALELLDVARAGLERIAGTVALMSRYGRAGYRRERGALDAWEAVRTAVALVLPATGRDVRVEVDLSGDGTLECVPEEFQQVVTNLLQNAIEAAPDGGGHVRIAGRRDGADLVLGVKDDGAGIPPEAMARIFTPFFTTKGPGRGTGLGLTISRRVVESLGGTLRVASRPGAGAEFVVRVPHRRPGP